MHADALICSHPRSGGRWLRFLLAHYLSARHRLGVTITPETVFGVVPDHDFSSERGYGALHFRPSRGVPLVAVCHRRHSAAHHRGYPTIFLVRNAYDVVVSAHSHLTQVKGGYVGSVRDFIRHPTLGLPSWIAHVNSWAPSLLTHRDAISVAYGELDESPEGALERVLTFLDQPLDAALIEAAAARGAAFRAARTIRTGQEGNFWDHLQPEEIFDIQAGIQEGLSEFGIELLRSSGIDLDPFPRKSAGG